MPKNFGSKAPSIVPKILPAIAKGGIVAAKASPLALAAIAPIIGTVALHKALTDKRSAEEQQLERDSMNPRVRAMMNTAVNNEIKVDIHLDKDGRLIDKKVMEKRTGANSGVFSALFE
jgi:hypothetical protein